MILRSATRGWSGNSIRNVRTAFVHSAMTSGVPISSQSAPASTAIAAIRRASSIVFRSRETCTIPWLRSLRFRPRIEVPMVSFRGVLGRGLESAVGVCARLLVVAYMYGRGSAEPPIAGVAQEVRGCAHLLHAVDTVLDADPAVVSGAYEDRENAVVVVEPLADHPVLEVRGVTDCAIGLA